MVAVGDDLVAVHLPSDSPDWIRYAGGKARLLLSINQYSWTNADRSWLQHNAPEGMTGVIDICKHFDRQLTALEVTERISQ
jgi:hypothetical protein